jgi:two-component system, LytTR family, response regulator
MNLKAVIIDDELNSIDVLKMLIAKYCPTATVVGEAEDADDGKKVIATHDPDIVFLDIEMPLGSGFDMLDKIGQHKFQVIFITAYNHYALKAIKYCALDYLLKPVDIDELINAVTKVSERLQHQNTHDAMGILKRYIQKDVAGSKIAIPAPDGLQFIDVHEIIRCEASGNYTRMHLLKNRHVLIPRTLKEYEEILTPYNFLRTHHAHLINLAHLEKYVKGEGGYAVMVDGSAVDISKRKKPEFLARFSGGL